MKTFFFSIICICFYISTSYAETIKVNFDDWCPYQCLDTDNPKIPASDMPGYEVEIINRIFSSKGYKVEYVLLPWSRAIKEVTEGRLDALLSPSENEAPALIFPEQEIGILGWCFYTKKESTWSYEGVSSLNKVMLGFLKGNYFGEDIQAYIEKNKDNGLLIQAEINLNWIEMNFKRLALGRITAILDEPFTLDYFIKKNNLGDKFRKAGCLKGQKMYVAFSPKNPKSKIYTKIFDKGIKNLRESGELQKILSAYGLKDWKPQH